MANALLGLAFLTPTTALGLSAPATNHPATNLLSITRPRRTWRSTSAASLKTVVLDFGTTTAITGGVFLNNANFAEVLFSSSNDLVSYTSMTPVWQAVPFDARVQRRKGLYLASEWTSTFNHRYLAVGCRTVDTPNPGYYELGAVAVLTSLTPLVNNWGVPHAWTPTEAVTRVAYAGGGSELTVEGPPRLVYDLQGAPWRTAALAQLLALRALGQDAPFVLYENRGDPAHVYLLKRIADVQVRESFRTFDAAWQFEECL